MSEGKEFLKECKEVRDNFTAIAGLYTVDEHLKLRTEIDTLLIMYGQLCERVRVPDSRNENSGLHKHCVNGSAWVILYQKRPLKNILFQSDNEARNYIKMQNPKRTFKEPKENVFVCSRYGTTFEIVELHYR